MLEIITGGEYKPPDISTLSMEKMVVHQSSFKEVDKDIEKEKEKDLELEETNNNKLISTTTTTSHQLTSTTSSTTIAINAKSTNEIISSSKEIDSDIQSQQEHELIIQEKQFETVSQEQTKISHIKTEELKENGRKGDFRVAAKVEPVDVTSKNYELQLKLTETQELITELAQLQRQRLTAGTDPKPPNAKEMEVAEKVTSRLVEMIAKATRPQDLIEIRTIRKAMGLIINEDDGLDLIDAIEHNPDSQNDAIIDNNDDHLITINNKENNDYNDYNVSADIQLLDDNAVVEDIQPIDNNHAVDDDVQLIDDISIVAELQQNQCEGKQKSSQHDLTNITIDIQDDNDDKPVIITIQDESSDLIQEVAEIEILDPNDYMLETLQAQVSFEQIPSSSNVGAAAASTIEASATNDDNCQQQQQSLLTTISATDDNILHSLSPS